MGYIKIQCMFFHFYFAFWATPNGAQGLLLTLGLKISLCFRLGLYVVLKIEQGSIAFKETIFYSIYVYMYPIYMSISSTVYLLRDGLLISAPNSFMFL